MQINFKIYLILVTALSIQMSVLAQKVNSTFRSSWVNENDRVCYIGNSITAGGEYCFFIDLYEHTRYPNLKFETYNCGIAGNTAKDVLNRMDSDILTHHPTVATIKLGMNDVLRELYSADKANVETLEKRENALKEYEKNMYSIAEQLTSQNCRLIILTPSIYDQTAKIVTNNNFGVNDALGRCAIIATQLAEKYKAPVVDFYSVMSRINHEKQSMDSTYTLVGNDRVHPGMPGHLVMAYTFFTALHADSLVSKIGIDARHGKVLDAINCEIKNLDKNRKTFSFEALSFSLPFPVPNEAKPALELVPFIQRLNQEILSVKSLKKGNYLLTIDKDTIGTFSDSELGNGINLALYPQTPQYRQATRVMDISWKRHQLISSKIRIMAMIEESVLKDLQKPYDMQKAKIMMDVQLEKIKGKDYYGWVRDRYADYLEMKTKEEETIEEIKQLEEEIYRTNKPISHHYQIIRFL